MGTLTVPIRLFQDLTSLGGTYRIRVARNRYARLSERHDRICARLTCYNNRLAELKEEIEEQVDTARSHLRVAGRILKHAPGPIPAPVLSPAIGEIARVAEICVPPVEPAPAKSMKITAPTVAGIGMGAATSAGTWVTTGGHAATAALPAAASVTRLSARAGLAGLGRTLSGGASFPGGAASVAALAAAPLAIQGLSAVVALAVATGMSHSRANRLSVVCGNLQQAHTERSSDLEKIRAQVETLESFALRLKNQDRTLWRTIGSTRKTLFPNGPLSHWRRFLSGCWRGNYYESGELALIEQLECSVAQFVNSIKSPPASARRKEREGELMSLAQDETPSESAA